MVGVPAGRHRSPTEFVPGCGRVLHEPDQELCENLMPFAKTRRPLRKPDALCENPTPFAKTRCPLRKPDALCENLTPFAKTRRPLRKPDALCENPTPFARIHRTLGSLPALLWFPIFLWLDPNANCEIPLFRQAIV